MDRDSDRRIKHTFYSKVILKIWRLEGWEKKFRFSRPLTWLNNIPRFSKVLFLFFLGAEIFYNHLEQEAISLLTGKPNSLAELKAAALTSFIIIGFISVFLNFKPKTMPENHIGPLRFLETSIKGIMSNIKKRGWKNYFNK